MRVISFASLISFSLQIYAVARIERVNVVFAVAGILLYLASFSIFWRAVAATRRNRLTLAFSEDQPQHLQTAGPYRFVRHPFYLAYLLFWTAGLFAAAGEWFLFATLAAMFALYLRAARLEEAKFAASELTENYSQYRAKTGMFLPNINSFNFSGDSSVVEEKR